MNCPGSETPQTTVAKEALQSASGSRRKAIAASLCVGAMFSPLAQAADGEDWKWMVAPYLWAVSFGTDLERTQPPVGGASNDTGFEDVIDKLDGAFQIHAEGQGEHWGVFTDVTYLGLADEKTYPRFSTETDLDARLFEMAAVWSPDSESYRGLDLFAGLRYVDVDLTVQFDPENPTFDNTSFDESEDYADFMIGARYTWAVSDRWALTLRGDGSFGDTEGTWNASGVASYRMKRGAWLLGYRYMEIELETDDSNVDLTMSGPMIGYGFIF